jgi:hypothetical protein
MSDDFDSFLTDDGTEPPDGTHTAHLERAVVRDTKNGKAIKIEWRTTDLEFWWESWHNTTGGGKARTQQLIDDLEIDREKLKGGGWSALEDALLDAEDQVYEVKVSHSQDGRFLNTAVVGRPDNYQPSIPIDTRDFETAGHGAGDRAAVGPAKKGLFDDDDVPF